MGRNCQRHVTVSTVEHGLSLPLFLLLRVRDPLWGTDLILCHFLAFPRHGTRVTVFSTGAGCEHSPTSLWKNQRYSPVPRNRLDPSRVREFAPRDRSRIHRALTSWLRRTPQSLRPLACCCAGFLALSSRCRVVLYKMFRWIIGHCMPSFVSQSDTAIGRSEPPCYFAQTCRHLSRSRISLAACDTLLEVNVRTP
jgi:hypothetical protein